MAFKFRCPMCGKRLTVEEAPGAPTTCPHCNQTVTVPADAAGADGAANAEAAAADAAAMQAIAPQAEGQPPAQEEMPQGGMDNVMGWLALYLPSWGTSFILHAAIVILMFFMAWQTQQLQPPAFEYRSAVLTQQQQKVEKKDVPPPKHADPKASAGGRGKGRPGPSSILHQYNGNPVPDVANGHTGVRLNVLGVGGGGNEIGGFEGLGNGSGRGFFGTGATPETHKIIYIVDRSGSMMDSIDFVKYELSRSIRELAPENQFYVIFFSSGPPMMMPATKLLDATDKNKAMAFDFIDNIVAQGQTDPSEALKRAFAMQPDLIYLLTDGEFDKEIVPLIRTLNAAHKVTVHTFCYMYKDPDLGTGTSILKQIAKDNGPGEYKFISQEDLAALSGS